MRHELYGESVFTSFQTVDGKVAALGLHYQRLISSLSYCYGVNFNSIEEFKNYFELDKKLEKLFEVNKNSYFRVTFYSLEKGNLNKFKFGLSEIEMDIKVGNLPNESASLRLKVCSYPFSKSYRPIKFGSYAQQLQGKKLALKSGFDDCLYQLDGQALELSTSNIVFRKKSGEFVSPRGDFFLSGITLGAFRKFCEEKKYSFEREEVLIKSLGSFSEVYGMNSVRGIFPIICIENYNYKNDPSIMGEFKKYCQENL